MLRLRSEIKESLLLVFFTFLLSEFLSMATMAFVGLGAVLVILKIRPTSIQRNVVALGVFGSYWWTYGKVIDPEVGLNFLVSVIVLKLLEKETLRDRFMIFFGMLLVISAGSLFEKTLSYVLFFSFAFFVLIQDFYQNIGARWKIGELLKALIWVVPLTVFLFFMAPRAMSPLPFQQGTPTAGEVSYTANVNISQVESLAGNDTPVFDVKLSRRIAQKDLYWRGNSITFTDGWNWIAMNRRHPKLVGEENLLDVSVGVHQIFRVRHREDYFFTLDRPQKIAYKGRTFALEEADSIPQSRGDWSPRYDVTSVMDAPFTATDAELASFQRMPLSRQDREWINQQFPAESAIETIQQVRAYFVKNKFTYSLAPGKISNFREFMEEKKTGFCSHYASALGIILRSKKMPARLVSGFMGGEYNRFADHYEISQNDAHVWVEVAIDHKWERVDPTGWMAPDRLSLGGEAFMASSLGNRGMNFLNRFGWFYDMKMWFSQWDFVFYQWLEEMDYQYQETWIRRFNLERTWVYGFAILSLAIFMGIYAWNLKRSGRKQEFSIQQQLWHLYLEKLESKGLKLYPVSLDDTRAEILASQLQERDQFIKIWDKLVKLTFAGTHDKKTDMLLNEIKKL